MSSDSVPSQIDNPAPVKVVIFSKGEHYGRGLLGSVLASSAFLLLLVVGGILESLFDFSGLDLLVPFAVVFFATPVFSPAWAGVNTFFVNLGLKRGNKLSKIYRLSGFYTALVALLCSFMLGFSMATVDDTPIDLGDASLWSNIMFAFGPLSILALFNWGTSIICNESYLIRKAPSLAIPAVHIEDNNDIN